MNTKQKSFLDDLAALCVKYHVEEINSLDSRVLFTSNGDPLSISAFHIDKITGKTCFTGVRSTENYYPDEPEDTKLGPPPGKRYYYNPNTDETYLVDDDD